jgi:signal transduction histidine kinase
MSDTTPPTILVVDDQPASRYSTTRALRAAGYAVLEAETAAQGMALLPRATLVVLDVKLPDADGRDVCRDLRARPDMDRLPVVHLSAVYVDDADKVHGLDAGADAYLTHPVDPAVLVATVRALLRARRAEERAARAKDDFLAAASHELRTPLSAILLWARLLESGRVPGGDTAAAVRTIIESAEAQQRLVDDLLDVSAAAGGHLRLDLRDVDLPRLVRDAVETVRPMATAKGVGLDVTDDLGPHPCRLDPGRAEQVVWNLVTNAVKFTPRGGRVTVRLSRDPGVARLEVADTGEGIDPAFLPHVFERFGQADTSLGRRHGGLGLGLTIAREIVELHGGTIRAASDGPGRGTTVTVEFPTRQPTPPA